MSDKHLSGEEKRAILREQYKQEFREKKAYLERLRQSRRINTINRELGKMEAIANTDTTSEWVTKLEEQSVVSDAKLDLALDANLRKTPPVAEVPGIPEKYAHLTALERVKLEMGLITEAELGIGPDIVVPETALADTPETPKTLGVAPETGQAEDDKGKTLGLPVANPETGTPADASAQAGNAQMHTEPTVGP